MGWKRVGTIIPRRLKKAGLTARAQSANTRTQAQGVIERRYGKEGAENLRVLSCDEEVVVVRCSNSRFAAKLRFDERTVLQEVRDATGTTVRRLTLRG